MRILPFSKPYKDKYNIENYHPINNLNTVGKIIDQYFQDYLIKFLDENRISKIIIMEGGRVFQPKRQYLKFMIMFLITKKKV